MKELVRKLRKYEIRIRKAVNSHMHGNFQSIFKGTGLEFDDVRAYQYGDDIRTIDWNVTAKGHGTFVKTFKEEKEQTILFMVDVSGSQDIGNPAEKKIDISKEICGVLSLAAIKEHSWVGLQCFSDQKEAYIRPGRGMKQAYQIFKTLYELKPDSTKTDINKAIVHTLNTINRRSVIILISDFLDRDYQKNLKALARQHDLVVIHIVDPVETEFTKLGIVPLVDKENKKTVWVNTSSNAFRSGLVDSFHSKSGDLAQFCRKHRASYIKVNTQEDYVTKLIRLFKVRNSTRKSA
jgi:uncharacterized protein (DUF58 family)